MTRFGLSLAALLLPIGASAQSTDCANPMTQTDMNICAGEAYRRADEDLNLAYGMARDMARSLDRALSQGQISAETSLRDAQRLWITFRDKACEAESLLAQGGSMQPLLRFSCLERLTRQRTEDLRLFGEMN